MKKNSTKNHSDTLDAAVDKVLSDLRASGAALDEIRAAAPGVRDALFTKKRIDFLFWFVPLISFLILAVVMALLGVDPNNFNRIPFYLSPLYYTFGAGPIVEAAASNAGWAGGVLACILVGSAAVFRVSLRDRQSSKIEMTPASVGISIVFFSVGFYFAMRWMFGAIALLSAQSPNSAWILVLLSAAWAGALLLASAPTLLVMQTRCLSYFEPGRAAVAALSDALSDTRDVSAWHDTSHRLRIARAISAAADALDRDFRRSLAATSGPEGEAAVSDRLACAGAAIREKLVWLATPMSNTRLALEVYLRDALLAASLGELHRIGTARRETAAHQPRGTRLRKFLSLLGSVALAIGPVVGAWLTGFLDLRSLDTLPEQSTLGKAALIWSAIVLLRVLVPRGFKETLDTFGGMVDRANKSSGG